MCRFLVYKGSDELLLSKLILDPTHSILKQSFDSRLRLDTRRGANNADGFGIGFYADPKLGPDPCLFTSTSPAWNCTNLQRMAHKTASQLIFAHVRATTEGSPSEENCHPFTFGSLMWMHNGGLGGWQHIKRRLGERLADRWYLFVSGSTDSEWAFALFLDTLERMGHDPARMPNAGFGPTVLRKALMRTIALINELIDAIPESIVQAQDVDTRSLLNFAVTDGHSVICTRYISSSTDEAASLYYSSGSRWEVRSGSTSKPGDQDYVMERRDKGADIVLVASEPLTFERENWVNVPTNSILTIHKQTVMAHPILDKYYVRSPYHVRSSAYVHTKGFITNEKRPMTPTTAAITASCYAAAAGAQASGAQLGDGASASQFPFPHPDRRLNGGGAAARPSPCVRNTISGFPSSNAAVDMWLRRGRTTSSDIPSSTGSGGGGVNRRRSSLAFSSTVGGGGGAGVASTGSIFGGGVGPSSLLARAGQRVSRSSSPANVRPPLVGSASTSLLISVAATSTSDSTVAAPGPVPVTAATTTTATTTATAPAGAAAHSTLFPMVPHEGQPSQDQPTQTARHRRNIKVKRRSLSSIELSRPRYRTPTGFEIPRLSLLADLDDDMGPAIRGMASGEDDVRLGIGIPQKVAKFFPELGLSRQ